MIELKKYNFSKFRSSRCPVIIRNQFPSVWHIVNDSRDALDANTIHNLAAILRVFTAKNLRLHISNEQQSSDKGSREVLPFCFPYLFILLAVLQFLQYTPQNNYEYDSLQIFDLTVEFANEMFD